MEINDLPADDIWPMIFRNLSINDLFTCRLVNKKFKQFSDRTNGINKLIIGESNLCEDFYWYYNDRAIEDKEIINLKCFRTIKLLSIFNLDKYLKHLKINDIEFELKELTNLTNLESLEFSDNYRQSQQIINLNNLKVFASNCLYFELNTPKLEKIQFDDINRIRFKSNLNSIKHLITSTYSKKLESFRNLEIMELTNIDQSRDRDYFRLIDETINENLLIIFKHLKKLKLLIKVDLNSFQYLDQETNDSLIKILNDKVNLKRKIDIYLSDIKIENVDKFNQFKAYGIIDWPFMMNNYDLLDSNLSHSYEFNYKRLERCVINMENDLPTSFFDKFQRINGIRVSKVGDVDGLNWFLNNYKYLRSLSIKCEISDQLFYNNLPNTIRYLHIYNKVNINYNFILKLPKLFEFNTYFDTQTNKDLFDLALTSFLNLKYLVYFRFRHDNRDILIKKKINNSFILLENYKLIREFRL